MKKLMIALGVVATAMAVNAAHIQWSIDAKSFTMSDGSLPNDVTAYLLDTGASTYADFKTALVNGSAEYATLGDLMASTLFTEAVIDNAQTYRATNPGSTLHQRNYAEVKIDENEDNTALGSQGNQRNYVILVADGNDYLLSTTTPGTVYNTDPGEGAPAKFADTNFAGGWDTYTASAVPEPTSGLLLLLGVAGLALRRKRV